MDEVRRNASNISVATSAAAATAAPAIGPIVIVAVRASIPTTICSPSAPLILPPLAIDAAKLAIGAKLLTASIEPLSAFSVSGESV